MSLFRFLTALLPLFFFIVILTYVDPSVSNFKYPNVRRNETVFDDYFGSNISDPYRWLENLDSRETERFIGGQNNLTRKYVDKYTSRKQIRGKMEKRLNYTVANSVKKAGLRYFILKYSGLKNQEILYTTEDLDGELNVILDPNEDCVNEKTCLAFYVPSNNGDMLAYALDVIESVWLDVQFKNVSTDEHYKEVLRASKFTTVDWTHDNLGIFYAQHSGQESENSTSMKQSIYYHRMGTLQSEDVLIVEFPRHQKQILSGRSEFTVSSDGQYLILTPAAAKGENNVYYVELPEMIRSDWKCIPAVRPLITNSNAVYKYITNDGPIFYFQTNHHAPNFRIVSVNLKHPYEKSWKILIPEREKYFLGSAHHVNKNMLVLNYVQDVNTVMALYQLSNGSLIRRLPLHVGSLLDFSGNQNSSEFFFQIVSWTQRSRVFQANVSNISNQQKELGEDLETGMNRTKFITKTVDFTGSDGFRIPLIIIHRKEFQPSSESPCFLVLHDDGLDSGLRPHFQFLETFMIEHFDGNLAILHLQGGRSLYDGGRAWTEQYSLLEDIHAAAEYLIDNNYSNRSKLILSGNDNLGSLVAASINQRPELYGAAIIKSGLLDLLRFHKFTDGYFDYDYDSENIRKLIKLSPLHNIHTIENETTQFPATFLLTEDHNDRVAPFNSYKFIAELQYQMGQNKKQKHPFLLRVESTLGNLTTAISKSIEEYTDIYCFLVQSLGLQLLKS